MKYGLCIGINYTGTPHELRGCHKDANRMSKRLSSKGYKVKKLLDGTNTPPTAINICNELGFLMKKVKPGDCVVIHYSGHGSWIPDKSGDERDNKDECIVASDNTFITDDQLLKFAESLPEKSCLFCLFDCCHSGTIMDLQYRVLNNRTIRENKKNNVKCNVVCVSGCMDNQTSADAFIGGQFQGAMSWSFFRCLKPGLTVKTLVDNMRKVLKLGGYTQIPQLTTNNPELAKGFINTMFH